MSIIVTYPLNIKLFSFLRATDILIIGMFLRLLYLNKFLIPFDTWLKVFSLLAIAATINGLIFVGFTGLEKLPFIF